jgi:hypothetical protein
MNWQKNGFIQRSRKITGSNFVKALLFAWLQNHSPSVEGIARAGYSHGLRISAQGLDKRFTPAASDLMRGVLEAAVAQVITASHEVDIDLLNRFTAVYLADTSTVALPTELETVWQGVGGSGNASQAALKIDTCLELKNRPTAFGLVAGSPFGQPQPGCRVGLRTGQSAAARSGLFQPGPYERAGSARRVLDFPPADTDASVDAGRRPD